MLRTHLKKGDTVYIIGTVHSEEKQQRNLTYYDIKVSCVDSFIPVTTNLLIDPHQKVYRYTETDYDQNVTFLAAKLRELRQDNNISQREIAEFCGVRQATVSYWEQGLSEPRLAQLHKLAEFFDIAMEDFLGE